jgi:hypothetical protein
MKTKDLLYSSRVKELKEKMVISGMPWPGDESHRH